MSRLQGHYVAAVALAIGIVVVALYPQFRSDYDTSTVSQVGIYFIAIIGLNVVTGYNGQISLGQGAFMGIGAYTTAIMAGHDISVWWSIPVAAAAAGAVGFVFGFPALRLHGPYLALGTFALAIAFFQLLQSARPNLRWLTNGGQTRVFGEPSTPYYQTWSIALGLLLLAWLVLSGKLGRSFRAVRDAELAAVSSGLNPAVFKTLAFGIAAAYAGIAGALLAIQLGSVNYLTFVPLLSITLLVGAAIGGFSALSGTIVGALFIVYAPLKAEDFSKKDWWSTLHLPNPEQAPSVLYGLFLLGLLFLMPGGAAQLFARIGRLLRPITKRVYSRPTEAEGTTPTRSES